MKPPDTVDVDDDIGELVKVGLLELCYHGVWKNPSALVNFKLYSSELQIYTLKVILYFLKNPDLT